MTFLDQWISRGRPEDPLRGGARVVIREAGDPEPPGYPLPDWHPLRQTSASQPCNACDTVDYTGELDEAGRCAECAAS